MPCRKVGKVRFQFLIAKSLRIAVLQNVVQCSLAPLSFLMMEAINTSETSVNIFQTTKLKIPEDNIFLLEKFLYLICTMIVILGLVKGKENK
jgi:hypothetical protein